MNLTRINPNATAVIRCPAGCLHMHTFELLALRPDTREPQLLIPYVPAIAPHPN